MFQFTRHDGLTVEIGYFLDFECSCKKSLVSAKYLKWGYHNADLREPLGIDCLCPKEVNSFDP